MEILYAIYVIEIHKVSILGKSFFVCRIKILSILNGSTILFLYIQCNYYTLKTQIYVLSLSLHYRNVLETIDRRRRNSRFFSEYLCFSFVIILYSSLVLISFLILFSV